MRRRLPRATLAASKYGATAEIARAIADVLVERGLDASVLPPGEVGAVRYYDAVVLGSAVYTGHWLEPAKSLVNGAGDAFAVRPVWRSRAARVGDPARKLVQKMGADPVDLAEILEATEALEHRVFEGKLERKNLRLAQKAALMVFRGLEGEFRSSGSSRVSCPVATFSSPRRSSYR